MSLAAKEIASLARARLLDPSPEAVERLERAFNDAVYGAQWERASVCWPSDKS